MRVKKLDIQRLRNLTTGRLHADIGFIYEDLERLTGMKGLMTHMLPREMGAVKPWLKASIIETRFWDDTYDTEHVGDYDLPETTDSEKEMIQKRYMAMPSPLANLGKSK